jgi:cytochrome c5
MSRRLAYIGVILGFSACATSAPAPEAAETPLAASASDSTAAAMAMHDGSGGMHRHGMGDREGMGEMRRERMRDGGGGGMQMRMGRSGEAAPREVPPALQEGERIYREICAVCHTMDPPPNLAPPMSHVARHLRQAFQEEDAAVAHIVSFVPEPDAERSILPEMARERFGLMPALPLPQSSLEAVGRYLWFLATPE